MTRCHCCGDVPTTYTVWDNQGRPMAWCDECAYQLLKRIPEGSRVSDHMKRAGGPSR